LTRDEQETVGLNRLGVRTDGLGTTVSKDDVFHEGSSSVVELKNTR
jgi:hypothetical protein